MKMSKETTPAEGRKPDPKGHGWIDERVTVKALKDSKSPQGMKKGQTYQCGVKLAKILVEKKAAEIVK